MELLKQIEAVSNYMGYEGQHEEWCGNNVMRDNLFMGGPVMTPYRPNECWDDLMPVIEKISQYVYETFNDNGVTRSARAHMVTFGMINDETGNYMVRIAGYSVFEAPTLIAAAWLAVSDFVVSLATLSPNRP